MFRRKSSASAHLAIAAVLAATVAVGCGGRESEVEAARAPAEPAATPVNVTDVRASDISATLTISGSLTPQSRVEVGSKLPGRLDRVLVDIGDRVQSGQVVAVLDAREIDAQVDAARAAVNVARAGVDAADATLSNAVVEHERAANLFDKGAIPRQRLDAAETARRGATAQRDLSRANLAQAEAALRRAEEVKRDTRLFSPIAGVVVERNFDAGNLVSSGDKPVVVVADTRTLKLEAGVGELDAGRLRVGMPARVQVQARPGASFDGELAAIAPEIDAKNRQFQIQVRIANPRSELLSGMYATARIETAQAAGALTVPSEAIANVNGRRVALRVRNDRVQPVPVTEGLAGEGRVQIVAGLAAGDVVIADARKPLPEGTRVKAVR